MRVDRYVYILEFHERNLDEYVGGSGRAFYVKKRMAPARFGLARMGREESRSEHRPSHGPDSAHGIVMIYTKAVMLFQRKP